MASPSDGEQVPAKMTRPSANERPELVVAAPFESGSGRSREETPMDPLFRDGYTDLRSVAPEVATAVSRNSQLMIGLEDYSPHFDI